MCVTLLVRVVAAVSSVAIEPIVWTIRFYPDGGGFPGPFVGVCTIQAIGPRTIFVSALNGTVTRKHLTELAEIFYGMGYRFTLMQRHGKVVQRKIERFLR